MPASASWARPERPEDLVEGLSSLDSSARLKALRDVKNQIIGNKTKKLSYIKLGAVPRVVEILASSGDEGALLVQSAAAVGSFACGNDAGVAAVLDSGVLPHLLAMLSNGDVKVVEAGARSLRMIFQSSLAPRGLSFQSSLTSRGSLGTCHTRMVELILALLTSRNDAVVEAAASVLARCCESRECQSIIAATGGMQALAELLRGSPKKREAALDAFAELTKSNSDLARSLTELDGGQSVDLMVRMMKDKAPRVRLLSCLCLVAVDQSSPGVFGPQGRQVRAAIMSTLIKLFDQPGQVGEEAPVVVEALVGRSKGLLQAAHDADAVTKLAKHLRGAAALPGNRDSAARRCEVVLRALSVICGDREESRRHLLELKALGPILDLLYHESPGVRAAACICLCSISRSIQNLRKSLSSTNVINMLLALLRDPVPHVQTLASAALCNVMLDFGPTKPTLVAGVALPALCQLARSMEPSLRVNATCALKNAAFAADLTAKDLLLKQLGVAPLLDLIQDDEEEVQEQALGLLRNLVHGQAEDISHVLDLEGGALLAAAERQLYNMQRPQVCLQALYALSNVATGSDAHKDAVMDCLVKPAMPSQPGPHIALLLRFLQDPGSPSLRLAALWCAVNLSYPEGPVVSHRVLRLQEAGVEEQLQALRSDPCLDVRDRAALALEQFAAIKARLRRQSIFRTRNEDRETIVASYVAFP